jgi:hypothetical protein
MIFKTEVCLYTTFVRKYDHLIILRHFNPISNKISGRMAVKILPIIFVVIGKNKILL